MFGCACLFVKGVCACIVFACSGLDAFCLFPCVGVCLCSLMLRDACLVLFIVVFSS